MYEPWDMLHQTSCTKHKFNLNFRWWWWGWQHGSLCDCTGCTPTRPFQDGTYTMTLTIKIKIWIANFPWKFIMEVLSTSITFYTYDSCYLFHFWSFKLAHTSSIFLEGRCYDFFGFAAFPCMAQCLACNS